MNIFKTIITNKNTTRMGQARGKLWNAGSA